MRYFGFGSQAKHMWYDSRIARLLTNRWRSRCQSSELLSLWLTAFVLRNHHNYHSSTNKICIIICTMNARRMPGSNKQPNLTIPSAKSSENAHTNNTHRIWRMPNINSNILYKYHVHRIKKNLCRTRISYAHQHVNSKLVCSGEIYAFEHRREKKIEKK